MSQQASQVSPTAAGLAEVPTSGLLAIQRAILYELRRRGVLRTANAPAGDYAEYLVRRAYEGTLGANSGKSWDVQLPDGRTVQVKSRVLTRGKSGFFSPFRSFQFDVGVFVLFDAANMEVIQGVELTAGQVRDIASYREYVNGWIVAIRSLSHPDAVDVTDRLREVGTS